VQPERKIVKKIRRAFEARGARVFKIHGSDEGFQEVGIPDTLICLWGLFIGIEVKQPGAKLRPAQRVVLHEIFDAGGVAAVVETVEQAEGLLSELEEMESHASLLYYRGRVHRKWPRNGIS